MSYDFWKTGGLNPGYDDSFDDREYPTDTDIEITRVGQEEWAVTEYSQIIARTFSTYGAAALFADAYRRAKRERDKLHRGNR